MDDFDIRYRNELLERVVCALVAGHITQSSLAITNGITSASRKQQKYIDVAKELTIRILKAEEEWEAGK